MTDILKCASHGEPEEVFICAHLVGETSGLGFHREDPSPENSFPDAWCDKCEVVRAAQNGWNEQSELFMDIQLVCEICYERARIRNTRTSVSLADLATVRWKCSSCDDWHTGPCLDFSYDAPAYWTNEQQLASERRALLPTFTDERPNTFLDDDYCAIENANFFVRGIIHLPIIGTAETFRWGVWGSLSKENFETVWKRHKDSDRKSMPPMFSWLSTHIPEYPETLSLKMYAHIQSQELRPQFSLEPADHPLAQEYQNGMTAERVREIMLRRLRDAQSIK
jgi:hypothetical protein